MLFLRSRMAGFSLLALAALASTPASALDVNATRHKLLEQARLKQEQAQQDALTDAQLDGLTPAAGSVNTTTEDTAQNATPNGASTQTEQSAGSASKK